MDTMAMPRGGPMAMAWMPLCGQSWIGAAGAFLGMWIVMMLAMMLPALLPALWRYRQSVRAAGEPLPALATALVAAGYFLVWTLLGGLVFALGAAIMAVTMRNAALARAVPIAIGVVVLLAGALQLTRWKSRLLASCRDGPCRRSRECGRPLPLAALTAWRQGLRLGLDCSQCCAGLTAALLVTGMMDVPAMFAVTAGITLERLAPRGERIARIIGMVVIGAGAFLTVRAVGLS